MKQIKINLTLCCLIVLLGCETSPRPPEDMKKALDKAEEAWMEKLEMLEVMQQSLLET